MESTPKGGDAAAGGSAGEAKPKRKMKSAAQLEVLERTYLMETYPSESLRADLSVKLGLTDRQLQMWFCHRRLKDRKIQQQPQSQTNSQPLTKKLKKENQTVVGGVGYDDVMGHDGGASRSGSGSGSSPFEPRRVVARANAAVSRIGADMQTVKKYYEPAQSSLELRAIAFVEAQLGEPVREDGPILGMEFDSLPPGAFGAPIDLTTQQAQAGRSYDGKVYERRDTKPMKTPSQMPNVEHSYVPTSSSGKRKLTAGSNHVAHPQTSGRAPREYQFLPEQPSVRSENYGRADPSQYYNTPLDAQTGRVSSFSTGSPYHHGREHLTAGYGFQGQVPSGSVLPQQGRGGHVLPSASGEYDSPHRSPFTNIGVDAQVGVNSAVGLENSFLSSDRRLSQEDDATRIERKRKSEEVRIAREVEAHEKRIRKELEKQDILRRKREEQMRREMERNDRERRKEEERLMREKLREDERFQREQRRELERRERFLQKENLRAERMRQKEEQRKEKEAARLKAANERATARRIAKESLELIDDERLELMELAVSEKGLPSILSLDSETLQNLDLFRDMLITFPPKSTQLKMPFSIQPWTDSEENVGNLLMVWRFLITFADILEIWPFTLDEFVQALHDYEPRLLGEIHVALLRSIIKDIEDVARTPSIGLGANQNTGANLGGGHPQIVEGAYAWGFDIRCWQSHLNPMTWPEILRQFALSAGFGPQLKKRSLERAYLRDDNEGHDGEDIVSTLRNGSAAENALAVMQEKGFSQPRRSRHRLTPGTVKFAAFHVLSLEGSDGLTILEVAEKIQQSGLRDLTTSKTPEASIAAALSRDSNLFERTAPSTYCVKAAFRKDPANAQAILSEARQKVQIFENGYSDSEGEKETEDVERDEDFECDIVEDPEADYVPITVKSNEGISHSNVAKLSQTAVPSENGEKDAPFHETPDNGHLTVGKGLSSFHLEESKQLNGTVAASGQSIDEAVNCKDSSKPDQDDIEIDESNSGEPWVQGLVEGEYSDLSVEERLNALVALVGVAIEGNSIRVILEERMETANALKKQMWAEAQLDKRRMKEEHVAKFQYPPFTGIKVDPGAASSVGDGNHSPYVLDNKNSDACVNPAVKQESIHDFHSAQNNLNNLPPERLLGAQEFSAGPDSLGQTHGLAAEKSRAQMKSYIGHKAEEMYVYRSLPLGQDRRRNRYWQFVTSASKNDPGSTRIFFESNGGCWRLIDSEEGFDVLMASLDTRGVREAHLHSMLQRVEVPFKEAVRCSDKPNPLDHHDSYIKAAVSAITSPDCNVGTESPSSTLCGVSPDTQAQSLSFRIELNRTQAERINFSKRYLEFEKWIWRECFNPSVLFAKKLGKKRCTELLVTCDVCHDPFLSEENHCPICHLTFGTCTSDFSDHVNKCEEKQKVHPHTVYQGLNSSHPPRIRLLKAQLASIEACVPAEALQPLWTEGYRKSWGIKLQASSSAEELLQFLTLLEEALKPDYLSSNFETTKELLASSVKHGRTVDNTYAANSGEVHVLSWVPRTTAAVGLRLMELDASISYMLQPKVQSHKDKEASEYTKLPSRYAVVKNAHEIEQLEVPGQSDFLQEENWTSMGSGRSHSVRGRGGIRGGRGRGRSRGGRRLPRGGIGKESAGKSRSRGRGGRRRGRRTVRPKQAPGKRVIDKGTNVSQYGVTIVPPQDTLVESLRRSQGMDWERDMRGMPLEEYDNSISPEASDSDDNGPPAGYNYNDRGVDYGRMYHPKPEDYDYEEEDGEEDDEVDVDDEEDDMDMEMDGVQMGSEYGEGEDDDVEAIEDEQDGMSSASSDYSV